MTSLALLQLVSPALPVGGFSYSEGLEVQIQAGMLADERALEGWLEAELTRGSLRLGAASLVTLADDCSAWVRRGFGLGSAWVPRCIAGCQDALQDAGECGKTSAQSRK